ncbi:MAG: hypothetical protein L6Q37_15110 [Bdellovibrionaceae bacterium]|nr:hypothetical protein [Pseudobdellovibrionaceae bacterium]NUM57970.1 hypothetical protein [Pseudobdellovibrionaceae bacterium]
MNSLINSEGQLQQVAFVLGDFDTAGGACSGVACIIVGASKVIQMIKTKIQPSTCKEDDCEKSYDNKEDSNKKPSRGGFII